MRGAISKTDATYAQGAGRRHRTRVFRLGAVGAIRTRNRHGHTGVGSSLAEAFEQGALAMTALVDPAAVEQMQPGTMTELLCC